MNQDDVRGTQPRRARGVAPLSSLQWARRKSCSRILLVAALVLPVVQAARAADIYYARAIGHEFLPETKVKPAPAEREPLPELPGLGNATETDASSSSREMGTWSKVLIGVLVVGAIAALGGGGGGGQASVSTGGADSGSGGSAPPPPPPSTGGGGIDIGIGGGGIGTGGDRGEDRRGRNAR